MDVGVLLADRAEGSLSAGIAQGIDVCGRYVVIVGGLPIAESDWVVPTRHVVPDWAGLDHGALSSGRLWFQSAGTPVIFAEEGEPSLLGVVTLEEALLAVDPVAGRLVPTNVLRL